jgi:DNA-binding LacI/PurR family transcriptional regulator
MRLPLEDTSASPSVLFIMKTLEDRVYAGEYKNGQRLPSERTLAEEFQVSRATVRQVLDKLVERRLVVRASGCRPLIRAPESVRGPTGETARRNIGLWIATNPSDPGAYSVLHGVQYALDDTTFRLVMASPPPASLESAIRAEARFLKQAAEEGDIAGVILWYLGGEENLPALRALRAANVPMVFLDRRPPEGFEADIVELDNAEAARQMVKHLLAQGHRRIAHITNPERVSTVRERLDGYRRALAEADIPFRPELVLTGDFMEATDETLSRKQEELVGRLLSLPEPPSALFTVNDYAGLWLVEALRARGVRVPEDMAVAGFDDLERWRAGKPFLTTVRQPFERIGEKAAGLLRRRLETPFSQTYHHVKLDALLVIRASTGRG